MPPPTRRTFLHASAGTAALTALSYQRVLGANKRIGVGFIGYGLMGKGHVGTFLKLPDADLVAVSDVHKGRREEALSRFPNPAATAHGDFRKLLDDPAVTAVVVATPDHWHALTSMLACAAGKDVYVEKPLTLFVREGEWLQTVATRTKRIVQVGTQQRSGPHYARARDLIRGGKIGRVHSVRVSAVRNVTPGFGNPPDGDPPPELDYDRWLGPAPARRYNSNRSLYHFRWFWDYSGGQMTNLAAHNLDIVDWVLGLDTLRSVASAGGRFALTDNGETPDTQDALFRFDRWTATVNLRECSRGEPSPFYLEFYGTSGCLGITRTGFRVVGDPDVPPVNLVPGVRAGHPVGGPKAVAARPGKPRTEPLEDKTGDSAGQYLAHAKNFLDCIRSRTAPVSDLASAHRTSVACHLANLSLRLGRQLAWDFAKNDVTGDREAAAALVRPYRAPWDEELKALGVG
jgi:predicted dehydrogenase